MARPVGKLKYLKKELSGIVANNTVLLGQQPNKITSSFFRMKKLIAQRVYFWQRSTMTKTPRTRRKLPYHSIQFIVVNYFMKYIHENKM